MLNKYLLTDFLPDVYKIARDNLIKSKSSHVFLVLYSAFKRRVGSERGRERVRCVLCSKRADWVGGTKGKGGGGYEGGWYEASPQTDQAKIQQRARNAEEVTECNTSQLLSPSFFFSFFFFSSETFSRTPLHWEEIMKREGIWREREMTAAVADSVPPHLKPSRQVQPWERPHTALGFCTGAIHRKEALSTANVLKKRHISHTWEGIVHFIYMFTPYGYDQ